MGQHVCKKERETFTLYNVPIKLPIINTCDLIMWNESHVSPGPKQVLDMIKRIHELSSDTENPMSICLFVTKLHQIAKRIAYT